MPALVFAQLVDGRDVRVVQARQHLGLALETGQEVGVFHEGGMHNFDCHVAIQGRVVGFIDRSHAEEASQNDDLSILVSCHFHILLL